MRILRVIESKVWVHRSGRKASPYGAVPWTGAVGDKREDWTLETRGWTWEMSTGTFGLGRAPAATREEAETIMAAHNARFRR